MSNNMWFHLGIGLLVGVIAAIVFTFLFASRQSFQIPERMFYTHLP